ncbi:TPA: hypothetical protein ACH3X2_006147 [Trebouxia sp. C0005]
MQSIQHRSFCAAPGQAACCMNRMYRQHCAVGDWQMALVWACLTRKAEDDGCENITVNIALFLVTAFEESEDISNALPDFIFYKADGIASKAPGTARKCSPSKARLQAALSLLSRCWP